MIRRTRHASPSVAVARSHPDMSLPHRNFLKSLKNQILNMYKSWQIAKQNIRKSNNKQCIACERFARHLRGLLFAVRQRRAWGSTYLSAYRYKTIISLLRYLLEKSNSTFFVSESGYRKRLIFQQKYIVKIPNVTYVCMETRYSPKSV